MRRHASLLRCAAACAIAAAVCAEAPAQSFPTRPIRLITAEVGGTSDVLARLYAPPLAANLGQQVVIDNRPGGGGIVAATTVARSAPDGYTMLYYAGTIWLLPLLRNDLPYDVTRDFTPLIWATTAPNVLVTYPQLPVKSVADLIALAKAGPGTLNYGSGATGATPHLAAELFKVMAGVNIVRVNYRGTGLAINDLIGGRVHVVFSTPGASMPHVESGRLRALAVTTAKPTPLLPGLPTVASALPGYESISITGVFLPKNTPPALVARLNAELVRVLGSADFRERTQKIGVEPVASSPQEFAAKLKSEIAKWGKLIRQIGITPE